MLDMETLTVLLATCEGNTFYNRRDEAIIRLLVDAGVRAGEFGRTDRRGCRPGGAAMIYVLGKGRRGRAAPTAPRRPMRCVGISAHGGSIPTPLAGRCGSARRDRWTTAAYGRCSAVGAVTPVYPRSTQTSSGTHSPIAGSPPAPKRTTSCGSEALLRSAADMPAPRPALTPQRPAPPSHPPQGRGSLSLSSFRTSLSSPAGCLSPIDQRDTAADIDHVTLNLRRDACQRHAAHFGLTEGSEARTMATRTDRRPNVEVVELTPAQYLAAKKRALDSVGLTYKQLEKQARRGEFSSPRAKKVWVAIGGRQR